MNERLLTEKGPLGISELFTIKDYDSNEQWEHYLDRLALAKHQRELTANYFQTVVIPAERAAAREELIEEIEKFIDNNYMVIGGNHENWKSLVRWQQLKGGQ